MKGNENSKTSVLFTPSLKQARRLPNPQELQPFKPELSPSNKSDTSYIGRKIKTQERQQTNAKRENSSKKLVEELLQKVESMKKLQKSLREQINEIHKQNTELINRNQILRSELFEREKELLKTKQVQVTIRSLEQQLFSAQKALIDFEAQIKDSTQFTKVQHAAQKKNKVYLSEMEQEIALLNQINDMDKARCKELTQKIKQYQENESKNRKKVRELENKIQEKIERESSISSIRFSERESQNLKQKVRILSDINDRQKNQISELLTALDAKNIEQRSGIMSRELSTSILCSKNRISQLEESLANSLKQNEQLLIRIQQPKSSLKNESVLVQKQDMQKSHLSLQVSQLNEKLYNFNTQNNELREQKDYYYIKLKQLEEENIIMTEEVRIMDEKIRRYTMQVANFMESMKIFETLQTQHERLDVDYRHIDEEYQKTRIQNIQLQRKGIQLMKYIQELRVEGQQTKGELIQKIFQLEQLKQSISKEKHCQDRISSYKDESTLSKHLRQRNVFMQSDFYKFKQSILDELRIISLELFMNQSQFKQQQAQQVISSMRKRVDNILTLV